MRRVCMRNLMFTLPIAAPFSKSILAYFPANFMDTGKKGGVVLDESHKPAPLNYAVSKLAKMKYSIISGGGY